MICHGQGDQRSDPFDSGCCFIAGTVCPIRYFIDYSTSSDYGGDPTSTAYEIDTATILDNLGAAAIFANGGSTADDWARELVGNSPPQRRRVLDQLQGKRYVCQAAVGGVQDDFSNIVISPTQIDGAAFEAAWNANVLYTTAIDLPDGTNRSLYDYWSASPGGLCSQWQGTSRSQCCFAEDQTTNDTRSATLSETAVTIASRNGG